jgi:hypothetical protein
MLLRMLRGSRTDGGPSPLARLLALLVVAGLVGLTAPVTLPAAVAVVRWLTGVL